MTKPLDQDLEQPDITVRALADELAEREIVVSHISVWNLLKRENQTHKKCVLASEQNRPDVVRRRWQWRQRQAAIDLTRLVFIDGRGPRRTWPHYVDGPGAVHACAIMFLTVAGKR